MTTFKSHERQWDFVLTPLLRKLAQDRRVSPDGRIHAVAQETVGGETKNKYPWDKMEDGDFFIVPVTKSVEAQKTGLRQGAARKDIEVTIRQWYVETEHGRQPALQVTRIQGNIRLLRFAASLSDPTIKLGFDVKGCAERVRAWRRARKAEAGDPESTAGEDS